MHFYERRFVHSRAFLHVKRSGQPGGPRPAGGAGHKRRCPGRGAVGAVDGSLCLPPAAPRGRPRSVERGDGEAGPHLQGCRAAAATTTEATVNGRRPLPSTPPPLTGELVRLQPGLGVQPADHEVVGEAAGCRGAAPAAAAHAGARGVRGAQGVRGRAAAGGGAAPAAPAAAAASMMERSGQRRTALWVQPPAVPAGGGERTGGAARAGEPQCCACALSPGDDVMLLVQPAGCEGVVRAQRPLVRGGGLARRGRW